MDVFSDKAFAFTSQVDLSLANQKVLVAVSGGADSMALLRVVCDWSDRYGVRAVAVHVMHGIRGDEAQRDADFVKQMCHEWHVPLYLARVDVPHIAASEHMGLEEAGRAARYAIFDSIRQETDAAYVLTAHTASDQIETVMLSLMRGCGTAGLTGIPVFRDHLVRPLLFAERADIERYCSDMAIPFIHDSTNDDCRYLRNAVRHRALPLLTEICSSFHSAILRVARHAQTDEEYLSACAAASLEEARVGEAMYRRSAFASMHDAIRYRMFRLALEMLDCRSMEDRHYRTLCHFIDGEGGSVSLPGGVCITVGDAYITVQRQEHCPSGSSLIVDSFPFASSFGPYEVSVVKLTAAEADKMENVHNLFFNSVVDYDTIQGDLYVRCRQTGDRMHPSGRSVGKSIKKLMQEYLIPAQQRDGYPILCDDDGPVMIPGYCRDERVCPTKHTKHFLVCSIRRLPL
ncbi:MAG: tRNA lysidine(34) synthetase TilS [Ruminococcaceae bacterium]|nr:tRNA lysidine(34) synthetase TilS [Oscillospiraceae bacterium]